MTKAFRNACMAIAGLLMAVTCQANASNYYSSSGWGSGTYDDRHDGNSCNCNTQNNEPCCGNQGCLWYVTGELLFWRPELCGLESAFGNTTVAKTLDGSFVTTTVTESHEEPDFEWDVGFRLGIDLEFGCMDFDATWTHFDGDATFSEGEQNGRWDIQYDVADLTAGYKFCIGQCFYLKPFVGLRAAWIDQSLHSHLETLFTSSLVDDSTVFTDKDDTEDFWGVGPEIGLGARWLLGCDFSLYASVDVATYFGEVDSTNFDTDTFTDSANVCNGTQHHCFNSLATDGAIGIRWDKCWNCSCYQVNLMLNLAFEDHRIYEFSNLGSDGILSLAGGVIGVGIGFCY